jgi:hypothetical protein
MAAHTVWRETARYDDGVEFVGRDRVGGGFHLHWIPVFAVVFSYAGHTYDDGLCAGLSHTQEGIPQFQFLIHILSQDSNTFAL